MFHFPGNKLEQFTIAPGGSLGRSTMSAAKRQASSPGITALAPVVEMSSAQLLQVEDSDHPRRHSASIL